MRIQNNPMSINAYNNLQGTQQAQGRSLERLSSGFRINRAADDAAGLVISESLRSQVGGLKVAKRNAQDAVSLVQTAEGALTEVHSMLQRMRDLGVQSANDTNDSKGRTAIASEIGELKNQIRNVLEGTEFNGRKLFVDDSGKNKVAQTAKEQATKALAGKDGNKHISSAGASGLVLVNTEGKTNMAAFVDQQNISSKSFKSDEEALAYFGQYTGNAQMKVVETAAAGAGATEAEMVGGKVEIGEVFLGKKDGTYTLTQRSEQTTAAAVEVAARRSDLEIVAKADADAVVKTSKSVKAPATDIKFQVGANNATTDGLSISTQDIDLFTQAFDKLGIGALDVSSHDAARQTLDNIDKLIGTVSTVRGKLGATQNRLDHTVNSIKVSVENLTASESRIRDTDMAEEMMSLTRAQILNQAGTAMLSQANQVPQGVLSLLR